ncbi:MAG: hypothetical protein LBH85_00735 [Treponema sp.]|jgi:hypothetical protein|nr:hypothetical protein [Treponema sp.]
MKIKLSEALAAFLIFPLFFLNACNDVALEAVVFSPLNSYEMNVFLAEKQQSIDNNPIINSGDTLYPYFVHALPKEYPDIQGFQVFLRPAAMLAASGVVREEKLEYMFIHSIDATDGEDVPARTAEISSVYWTENTQVFVPTGRTMALPAFTLPETLDIGQYSMILRVVGKDGATLLSTEKSFYFLAEARFEVKDLQIYLPGRSAAGMAKAGACILLEVPVVWDEPLDPYVVWSDGGKIFNAGRIFEGANRILWKAPEIAGFKNIKATVFPFPPFEETQEINGATGIAKTVSIPITIKEAGSEYFAERSNEFTHWYALQGDLLDRKGGAPLQPQKETIAQWAPAAYTYGLSIGNGVYLISKPRPVEADMKEESDGGDSPESPPARTDKLEFYLNIVEDGAIVRAYYDYAMDSDSPASVMVGVVLRDGWLELLLNAGEEDVLIKKVRMPAIKPASPDVEEFDLAIFGKEENENHDSPVVSLSVTTHKNWLCADISVDIFFEKNAETQTEPVALPYPVSGAANFYFGSGGGVASVTAVISDLGVLFNLPAKQYMRQLIQQVAAVQALDLQEADSPPPPRGLERTHDEKTMNAM